MLPLPDGVTLVMLPLAEAAAWAPHPDELALLGPRAVEKRHRELRAGRRAAHLALERAGCAEATRPILAGSRRQPLWPAGWVGAITHAEKWAGAAVAPRAISAGVGLDVESLTRQVEHDLTPMLCSPAEAAWVGGDPLRLRAIFSAKESVFKALFPIAEVFLDFHDASLVWREGRPEDAGTFEATLHLDASPRHRAGSRYPVHARIFDDHVLTSLVLAP